MTTRADAPCSLTASELSSSCPAGKEKTFFIRYDLAAAAEDLDQKPELCTCQDVGRKDCDPESENADACFPGEADPEKFLNFKTQSVLTTVGSPCTVTVCSTVFGFQFCTQATITDPPPCTP